MGKRTIVFLIAMTLSFYIAVQATAMDALLEVGEISAYSGQVFVRVDGAWSRVKSVPLKLYDSDKILTTQGRAEVTFADGAVLRIDTGTSLYMRQRNELAGFFFTMIVPTRYINLVVGSVFFKADSSSYNDLRYKFRTPSMTAVPMVASLRMSVDSSGESSYAKLDGIVYPGGQYIAYPEPMAIERAYVNVSESDMPRPTPEVLALPAFKEYLKALKAGEALARAQARGEGNDETGLLAIESQAAAAEDQLGDAKWVGDEQTASETQMRLNVLLEIMGAALGGQGYGETPESTPAR